MSAWEPDRDPSGFYLLKGPGPHELWIESDRLEECLEYCRAQGLSHVALSPLMGYSLRDLEFLRDQPYIKGVRLLSASRIDISGLRHLTDLESLVLADNKQTLDLSQFERLRKLRADWHPKLRMTSECGRLEVLGLAKYNPRSNDLTELAELPALQDLSIVQSPLASIRGVGRFRKLKRLELSYLTKLESIAGIEELSDSQLEILECEKCKKIGDHAAVRAVPSLRIVRFNDCGEIPSISFLYRPFNTLSPKEAARFGEPGVPSFIIPVTRGGETLFFVEAPK